MNFRALDHSSHLVDPAGFAKAAKAAGFDAVLRYLPLPPGALQHDNVGRLTAEEVLAYHAAGLGIGIVWETTQYRPIMGAAGGSVDGFQARTAANALGFPPDHPIFGSVDFPPTPGQLPLVAAYLQTAGFEPYANGPTLTHLQARHSWMHNWGGSNFPDPHIHQQGGQVTIAGVACDLNDCYHNDCIWWPAGSPYNPQPPVQAQPQAPPVHFEEDNMTKLPVTVPALDDQGNGSVPIPGVAGRVVSVNLNGNDPNHEGYNGLRPDFQMSDRGSDVLLVIQGGKPHSGFDVEVWVAG
jgi:hypothetical protein